MKLDVPLRKLVWKSVNLSKLVLIIYHIDVIDLCCDFTRISFFLILLQGRMYKSRIHQTCKRVDAYWRQRIDVGGHACCTDVVIELYIQLKLYDLYDGHLYSVSSKS